MAMKPLKSVSGHLRRLIGQSISGTGDSVLVEGERLLITASSLSSRPPTHLLATCPRNLGRLRDAVIRVSPNSASVTDFVLVTESVMSDFSTLVTPSPCLAVFPKPSLKRLASNPPLLVDYSVLCWDVIDPSNVGGIARLSWCLGASRLLVTPRCASPWMPKVLRAGAGAHFAMPIDVWTEVDLATAPDALSSAFRRLLIASPTEGHVIDSDSKLAELLEPDLAGCVCLMLGSETRGLPEEVTRALVTRGSGHLVHVPMGPMAGQDAALNVATAGAVLLHRLQCLATSRKSWRQNVGADRSTG